MCIEIQMCIPKSNKYYYLGTLGEILNQRIWVEDVLLPTKAPWSPAKLYSLSKEEVSQCYSSDPATPLYLHWKALVLCFLRKPYGLPEATPHVQDTAESPQDAHSHHSSSVAHLTRLNTHRLLNGRKMRDVLYSKIAI